MVWYGMVWYGTVWYDMVWYGMVWYGMAWHGMGPRISALYVQKPKSDYSSKCLVPVAGLHWKRVNRPACFGHIYCHIYSHIYCHIYSGWVRSINPESVLKQY